jgi:hypothetical protein
MMSLEHTRFLWNNLFDDATLDASTEATDYPVENVRNEWPTFAWRATGKANEWISANLGTTSPGVQALVIKGHNFSTGASIRIQADDDPAYGSLDMELILPIVAETMTCFWSTPQNFRYWRITIADAGNTDTYVKVGRIFLGSYFAPAYDVSSYSMQITDPSAIGLSVGGQLSTAGRTHYKTWTYQFAYVKESDKETFEDIFAEVGFTKPYFIVENIYDSGSTRHVRNTSEFGFNFLFYDTAGVGFAYDMDFSVEEAR